MRRMILVFALLAPASAAQAQFLDHLANPTVPVTLNHPPGLGLKVGKIAFGPASGECADQIVEVLIADFVENQIEVVDREHLEAILGEHDLALTGYVDRQSAVAIGRILGPSALVFVKTQRCATTQDRLRETESRYNAQTKTNETVPVYRSRTRAFLNASIQTVDLATGRIFAARALAYSPEQDAKSYAGWPEAPAEFDVLDVAVRAAVTDIHRMFLPWSEPTRLVYYDDKACDLKRSFERLEAGDAEGAFELSRRNLETCRGTPGVKEKVLGHAFYNVGMGHMIRNEHDLAMEHFAEAARLRPGDIVTKAMADCQKAKELTAAMRQIEEKAAYDVEQQAAEGERSARAEASSTLTNADVIRMSQKKLPPAVIIQKIRTSKRRFDTSPDALVKLTQAGVSDQVIVAMMEP